VTLARLSVLARATPLVATVGQRASLAGSVVPKPLPDAPCGISHSQGHDEGCEDVLCQHHIRLLETNGAKRVPNDKEKGKNL